MRKLFNKCILINKWYYKPIVLNIGPRMHPPGLPAARACARPVRPQPKYAPGLPAAARGKTVHRSGWILHHALPVLTPLIK